MNHELIVVKLLLIATW